MVIRDVLFFFFLQCVLCCVWFLRKHWRNGWEIEINGIEDQFVVVDLFLRRKNWIRFFTDCCWNAISISDCLSFFTCSSLNLCWYFCHCAVSLGARTSTGWSRVLWCLWLGWGTLGNGSKACTCCFVSLSYNSTGFCSFLPSSIVTAFLVLNCYVDFLFYLLCIPANVWKQLHLLCAFMISLDYLWNSFIQVFMFAEGIFNSFSGVRFSRFKSINHPHPLDF